MNETNQFLKVGMQAALEAGRFLMKQFRKVENYSFKYVEDDPEERKQIISPADINAENIIKSIILKHFPDHYIYGEESKEGNENSDHVWFVDPLCGSKAYVRGIRDFNISIALVHDSDVLVGVVHAPAYKEVFHAIKGHGAFLNNEKIHVSEVSSLSDAMISIEHRLFRKKSTEKIAQKLASEAYGLGCMPNCGLEMSYVACGRIDALIKKNQPVYDYAAGMLIVREAGGTITDFSGNDLKIPENFDQKVDFIASNGKVHKAILRLIDAE